MADKPTLNTALGNAKSSGAPLKNVPITPSITRDELQRQKNAGLSLQSRDLDAINQMDKRMGLSFNENTGKYASSHSKAYDIDERITEKSLKSINTSPAKFVPSTERKYSNKSVQDKADKEYMDAEVNTLYADCEVVPDESAVKLKIGETVNVSGVGKYLSGEHYVHEISRRISKDDGYTVSMTLIRMGFGDSLKSVAPKNVVDAPVQTQKYVIKRGDTLWEIAEKYYGKGSEYTKIAEANGIKPIDYRRLKIGRELIIP